MKAFNFKKFNLQPSMNQTKQYKHIFFDLDHTIWDFDKNAHISMLQLYSDLNLESRIGVTAEEFYETYLVHNRVLWGRYEQGFISTADLKWKRMWRSLLDYKVADEPLARKMSDDFLELLPVQKKVFPYTFEILEYLQGKKYILHLITNGFEVTQRLKLKHSGLDKYFVEIITSECSQSLKPKKEIFDFALLQCKGLVEESIMIGDNLKADIQGAINAGMDSIYVNHINEDAGEIQPTYSIKHLKELEGIL